MSPAAFGAALLRASLDAALWIAALALVTHFVPRISPRVRCGLWWLASVKALVACLTLPVAAVPVPAHVTRPVLAPMARVAESARATLPALLPHAATPVAVADGGAFDPWRFLPLALLVVWAAGALFVAVRLLAASRALRARWRAATPLESPGLRARLATWLGTDRAATVELRTSPAVPAPLVLAGRYDRILLPETCRDGDAMHTRMALAHEASHLVRGDLVWAWVPALAECVFWFHPLLRWSVREYVQAREEACDVQAVRWSGAEPEGYGEMLVGFGTRSPRLGHAVSCGSPHVRHLLRRLRMLAPSARPGRTERVVALAAVIVFGATALVPIRLVAAREGSSPVAAREPAEPLPVAASARSTVDVEPARTAVGNGPAVSAHSSSSSSFYSGDAYVVGGGRSSRTGRQGFSYGIVSGGRSSFSGSVEDGDWLTVKRLQDHERGKVFWFRFDDRNYVVRDADAVSKVEDAMGPLDELGDRQSKLGDQQSRLGDRQSELGDRQSALGDRESELADRESDLRSRLDEEDVSASERAKIRSQLAELAEQREELARMQGDLGRLQGELGAQQGELGKKQGELGQLQGELAKKIQRELLVMSHRWVDDGRAEPVP